MAKGRPLTEKQLRFVEAFIGPAAGNAAHAARLAGYKGTPQALHVQGSDNLRVPAIKAAIDEHSARVRADAAMSIDECHAILAEIARNRSLKPGDRVAATDKALKARGAYITKVEHSGTVEAALTLTPEVEAALEAWLLVRNDPRVIAVIEELSA